MKNTKRICPKCGKTYLDYPAVSREDNRTEICPDCGVKEAMTSAGMNVGSQREVLIRMTKAKYLPGMSVRLLKMDDVQAPPVGNEGTVRGVDDIGSVMVAWDNGCGLNVVLGEDEVEIVE